MHKNLRLFFVICFVLNACSSKKGALIYYKSNIIDLGEITFKKEFPGKFMIYNEGDLPLKLLQATADCSCTVPENINNTVIPPKDSVYIHFKITPAVDGFLQQNIYLDNTSINEDRVLILIRANVKLINE